MLDLRLPTGWFFALAGIILLAMGLASPDRAALTDANVNLYCGLFMVAFGAIMLVLAYGARRKAS
jgi:uncharacterized membrane protein HdeD (DUF308 family)